MPDTTLPHPYGQQRLTVFSLCCGLGGQTRGFQKARIRIGPIDARWECIGGIDSDPAGLRDFERLTGAKGTLLDLFDRDQYQAFHGRPPPPGCREATADDLRRAAGYEVPDCVTISAPCKGISGLLSEKVAATLKYQALNRLTVRCVMLMLLVPPAFVEARAKRMQRDPGGREIPPGWLMSPQAIAALYAGQRYDGGRA